MENSRAQQSFFRDIKSRELNGFRVRKRPFVADDLPRSTQIGAVSVDHDGDTSPPMAISFCKTQKNGHILAVTDEAGYISLYNTRLNFKSSSTYEQNTEKSRILEWVAHDNAIFDICWIKIKLWDAQAKRCVAALTGHTGSVKAICSHPTNQDVLVSGSRDGSFALWDLKCSNDGRQLTCISPYASVQDAHKYCGRRIRRGKAASKSITSVLYLRDEVTIATAGAVDSVLKFWDVRNLKKSVMQASPSVDASSEKEKRLHGISSLSQDMNGIFISASCMDSRIYLYNILQLENGPVKTFSGCRISSFFVKSAISPDAAHMLSGSSDGNAYIWQVNKPQADPVILKSHDGEVTAVDWCPSEMGKVATSSDDFTVRFWNVEGSCYSNSRSPSSIRRRVMALPTMERRKLFAENAADLTSSANENKNLETTSSSEVHSPKSKIVCEISTTPDSQRTRCLSYNNGDKVNMEMTPESAIRSPSSVLNPPSSLKRKTIKDYFLAA
ncbi:OLC1v1011705C1 [Oldenlandia corymbosa var. corymbosa]|uniref:OLC1v1011705C1 n=1 Tax=Oldenlandia corymbosa var. corymbosa TaxID=529605 RepID=A0AAV1DUC7_OLDCO|nr:OLC1v1011705C1 [Oldenlandia corymbosa var. corymbosa]